MLELRDIKKVYELGKAKDKDYQQVVALNGVSIKFRESEFVSILGQSGCGKTTLLNIIGGLDKYTSGDLIINGKSTKNFSDKEWDTYRNHSVGFVFQSYNLIPHLTVLENVELALTLSGISAGDRRARAIEVLDRVGLKSKIKNKPSQLSGGQMQRVAIARALVNNPDVILADEPTGALDSKTSVQIMELLKEISKDKLIIMVTHNPDLAKKYSTRIIRLNDGELVGDTNPPTEDETTVTRTNKTTHKSMSFWSALKLSFKNLLTKKTRTILVSFAGSIGIIGIALILALSSGFQSYINKTQEDALSSYPITIEKSTTDTMALMMSFFTNKSDVSHESDAIYAGDTMSGIFEQASSQFANTNDIESFVKYLEEHKGELENYVSDIQYTYDMPMNVVDNNGWTVAPKSSALYDMILLYSCSYLSNKFNVNLTETSAKVYTLKRTSLTTQEGMGFLKVYLPSEKFNALVASGETTLTEEEIVSIISNAMKLPISNYKQYSFNCFNEMIDNNTLLTSQYELLGSRSKWATEANEAMLVLGENNEIDDYILYALGLITKDQMQEHMVNLFSDTKSPLSFAYNDVIGKKYKVLLDKDYFVFNASENKWEDVRNIADETVKNQKLAEVYASDTTGREVTIVGVVRLNEDSKSGQLKTGVVYTKKLTHALISDNNNSAVVKSGQTGVPTEISLTPASISFYATSFEAKNKITDFIEKYNSGVEEEARKITYSDYVGLMVNSVSTIINAISYILIGFVSVSLVVSSIMIGIITYISVLERIKEIGILRAVGASKKDIKRVFTAETFIIGLVAGVMGIAITLLLTIPVNIIIKHFTGIAGVASLPILGAVILIAISMLLTIIAGLIPAHIASKKDPVVALRSE